jgi:hypothetical protein
MAATVLLQAWPGGRDEPSILKQEMALLVGEREAEKHRCHRFCVIVWASWLMPHLTGALG